MLPEPALPGQTPLDDISGLLDKSIRTQAELNIAEAENIRKATVKYLAGTPNRRIARFDVPWALRLHKEMFGAVWAWAGTLRKREFNLGPASYQVEPELHILFDDLRAWETTGMPLLEQAVRLHHGAVRIHPFNNGNGRWSRMLGNIWLKLNSATPTAWPETVIGTNSTVRGEYLEAVRAADTGDSGAAQADLQDGTMCAYGYNHAEVVQRGLRSAPLSGSKTWKSRSVQSTRSNRTRRTRARTTARWTRWPRASSSMAFASRSSSMPTA